MERVTAREDAYFTAVVLVKVLLTNCTFADVLVHAGAEIMRVAILPVVVIRAAVESVSGEDVVQVYDVP